MTDDEKELGQASVSMCKALRSQAQLIHEMMLSQQAFVAALQETNPQLATLFLSHRQRIAEEGKNQPLALAMQLLDIMTAKLQNKYGPWQN